MTVILKRGDRIHLAVGLDNHGDVEAVKKQLREAIADLSDTYTKQGVTVVQWTGSTTLTHPVVVAVFRDEEGE